MGSESAKFVAWQNAASKSIFAHPVCPMRISAKITINNFSSKLHSLQFHVEITHEVYTFAYFKASITACLQLVFHTCVFFALSSSSTSSSPRLLSSRAFCSNEFSPFHALTSCNQNEHMPEPSTRKWNDYLLKATVIIQILPTCIRNSNHFFLVFK